jgi:hypothetical protein
MHFVKPKKPWSSLHTFFFVVHFLLCLPWRWFTMKEVVDGAGVFVPDHNKYWGQGGDASGVGI